MKIGLKQMSNNTYDVIIVGGGVMGCATAYYLLKYDPRLNIALLEMDSTYEMASTPLSDGNTRIQFNIKENIQMSQYGLEVLARFAEEMEVDGEKPDPAFRQQGNLFVLDEASREDAYEGWLLQTSLDSIVYWLTPEDVQRAHLKSRRKHSGSQQVKRTRHIKETKMAHGDRRHVDRREIQRTT